MARDDLGGEEERRARADVVARMAAGERVDPMEAVRALSRMTQRETRKAENVGRDRVAAQRQAEERRTADEREAMAERFEAFARQAQGGQRTAELERRQAATVFHLDGGPA